MRGYDRAATDELLKEISASYEEIWLERKGLRQQVEQLASEIEELRERERLIGEAVLTAERTADEIRMAARREAETILEEAKANAEEMLRLAEQERKQVESAVSRARAAIDRIRSDFSALLADALDRLGPEEATRQLGAESGVRGELLLLEDLTTKRQNAQE
jgi:cell division initiation protein